MEQAEVGREATDIRINKESLAVLEETGAVKSTLSSIVLISSYFAALKPSKLSDIFQAWVVDGDPLKGDIFFNTKTEVARQVKKSGEWIAFGRNREDYVWIRSGMNRLDVPVIYSDNTLIKKGDVDEQKTLDRRALAILFTKDQVPVIPLFSNLEGLKVIDPLKFGRFLAGNDLVDKNRENGPVNEGGLMWLLTRSSLESVLKSYNYENLEVDAKTRQVSLEISEEVRVKLNELLNNIGLEMLNPMNAIVRIVSFQTELEGIRMSAELTQEIVEQQANQSLLGSELLGMDSADTQEVERVKGEFQREWLRFSMQSAADKNSILSGHWLEEVVSNESVRLQDYWERLVQKTEEMKDVREKLKIN